MHNRTDIVRESLAHTFTVLTCVRKMFRMPSPENVPDTESRKCSRYRINST